MAPKKRGRPRKTSVDSDDVFRARRPKRAAVEEKTHQIVNEEIEAIILTNTSLDSNVHDRPNRRLDDFILHDEHRVPQPVQMLEVKDIFIEGVILPLDDERKKQKGVRCESFGRVESWDISGYDEDGSPVTIWISTEFADYECRKPATRYKKFYDYFFEKACACVAVYKNLSKNPDTSLDELLAGVVRSMNGNKFYSSAAAIQEFVKYQGEFICNQLVDLDKTAKKHDTRIVGNSVLVSLRDESIKLIKSFSNVALTIDESKVDGADETDVKYAKILQDEEYRKLSMKRSRSKNKPTSSSSRVYIINEDEIANDYPRPTYYNQTKEEIDELVVFDFDDRIDTTDWTLYKELHDWTLYNSDSRLISLELLPMQQCGDSDVNMFGSGVVTEKGYSYNGAESSTQLRNPGGLNVFLSQIKEWIIREVGADMTSVLLRTESGWYRLGKPSKQYAPWFEPVLKTARIGKRIFAMVDNENRSAKVSFTDVIKRLCELEKNNKDYISDKTLDVERYVVAHGPTILKVFKEEWAFVGGLKSRMEERHHIKWTIREKKTPMDQKNLNPRACREAMKSKMNSMKASRTQLINKIWGEFYSVYTPEVSLEASHSKEEVSAEEEDENEEEDVEDIVPEAVEVQHSHTPKKIRENSETTEIKWEGEIFGKTYAGEPVYGQALVRGEKVVVGGAIILEVDDQDESSVIYFVEYMFESLDHCKMLHGKLLQRGSETVLGEAANERELFLTNECFTIQLKDIRGTISFEIRSRPWGYQYRKEYMVADKLDRAREGERKSKDLPVEYYCKSLYSPERGGFFSLPSSDMGIGSGFCSSCKIREDEEEKSKTKLNVSHTGFSANGIKYSVEDFVYVLPSFIPTEESKKGSRIKAFKYGKNKGLRAYIVCQLLGVSVVKEPKKGNKASFEVEVTRFYRPEDISSEMAYASDIQELYYSQDTYVLPPEAIKGKCEVRKKNDMPLHREYPILDHIFFCELLYDSSNGYLKQLPSNMKLKFSTIKDDTLLREKKGNRVQSETDTAAGMAVMLDEIPKEMRLATLDIFAGCGGLSSGLEKAGVSNTKWAIEYEEPAGQAFKQNHPETTVFIENCNVILRAIMERCGDVDDCISTEEAVELATKLDENLKSTLPLPGQVDFINGGPPCQGFSRMNRFSGSTWSKVQCEMILAFLSFADYFRPKYFLLENVKNFVTFNEGTTFKLTLASLLEMGYQVRFGLLEAGAYGISQQRKRAFIWAAAPNEVLPEWPEPMHVFNNPGFNIQLSRGLKYASVQTTKFGAPFRSITVRDAIGDLPPIQSGESAIYREYEAAQVSLFQKEMKGNMMVLTDHICKKMTELNLIRCRKIPKRPGADWRDLPDVNVKLSNGLLEKLIPDCLLNKAHEHNGFKGLYGRLDWEGNLPTSITDPQPMGLVGMCFHPDQDRIISVRECARSQGFPDSYEFSGKIKDKHRQIGNAVPPPLAFVLGRKLKEALLIKCSREQHS